MKLSPKAVYDDLLAAGFTPAAAVTMTEIAGAESGFRSDAIGDTALESGTWGPSIGLFQIRTAKSATGTGGDRDIATLTGDPAAQARAAYDISHQGTNFSPWTTWTTGKYQQFATTVRQALGSLSTSTSSTTQPAANTTAASFPTIGPTWLPWNWPSDVANSAQATVGSIRTVVVEGLFAAAGVALVGAGVYGLTKVRPR